MTIYIAADHGGYKMKEFLKTDLAAAGYDVFDMGPHVFDPADDYPDFSREVAQAVADEAGSLGILLCRSGQGVCIAANKIKGVRAALAWNEEVAKEGRHDDHANVLCLPADHVSNQQAAAIVKAWLKTEPGKEDRHMRRVKKVQALEAIK